jgi:hypothetical protein
MPNQNPKIEQTQMSIKIQISKSKLQTNPNIKIQNRERFEHWYLML